VQVRVFNRNTSAQKSAGEQEIPTLEKNWFKITQPLSHAKRKTISRRAISEAFQ